MSFEDKSSAIQKLEDEEIKGVNLEDYEHLDEEQIELLKRRNKILEKEQRKKEEDQAAELAAIKGVRAPGPGVVEVARQEDVSFIDEVVNTQYLKGRVLVFTRLGKIFEVAREADEYEISSLGAIPINGS